MSITIDSPAELLTYLKGYNLDNNQVAVVNLGFDSGYRSISLWDSNDSDITVNAFLDGLSALEDVVIVIRGIETTGVEDLREEYIKNTIENAEVYDILWVDWNTKVWGSDMCEFTSCCPEEGTKIG